jgi:putative OPT family oligopeptide transporter
MSPGTIWTRYIRYIGAGGVACGGFITLIKAIPTIIESFRRSMRGLKQQMGTGIVSEKRTQQDLPLTFVLGGVALIMVAIAAAPHIIGTVETFAVRLLGAFCMAAFAFFFVTVSSRIVGLIGVTSNPTSGMTIATLLITSALFALLGWTDDVGKFAALTVGTVVAVAASIAGDMSQDLKTGFLIGATPKKQQIGELVGVLTAIVAVSASVIALHKVYGFGSAEIPAPQANMMKIVIEGVLQADIPWGLVLTGAAIAAVVELLGMPSLPFAVGVYLPVATFVPIFVGGIVRRAVESRCKTEAELQERRERGVLFGSGLVAGDGLLGVGIAFYALVVGKTPPGVGTAWLGPFAEVFSLLTFAGLVFLIWRATRVGNKN